MASKYTDEIVTFIADEYTVKRDAGELNRDILDYLVDAVAVNFDVELNAASLRAKLNGIEDAEHGFVYRKDTEAEKAILAERKGTKAKAEKRTKADIARDIAGVLKFDAAFVADLAKAKTDTLEAVLRAAQVLNELATRTDAEADAEA